MPEYPEEYKNEDTHPNQECNETTQDGFTVTSTTPDKTRLYIDNKQTSDTIIPRL